MSTPSRCCGHPLQVIPLRSAPAGPDVELLRCRSCARSRWRSNGTEISRSRALETLGDRADAAVAAPPVRPAQQSTVERRPRPAPSISSPGPAAPSRAAELRELLAGWQVLGS